MLLHGGYVYLRPLSGNLRAHEGGGLHYLYPERVSSATLPVGVLQELEIERTVRQLGDGDFVVMVTDGVLDALPVGNQEAMLSALIGGAGTNNPGELAHYLLEQVLELSGEVPADDMTILAVGLWKV